MLLIGFALLAGLAWACGGAWYNGPIPAWMPVYQVATAFFDFVDPSGVHDLPFDRWALEWWALAWALLALLPVKLAWDVIVHGHHTTPGGLFVDGAGRPLGHFGPFTWRRR